MSLKNVKMTKIQKHQKTLKLPSKYVFSVRIFTGIYGVFMHIYGWVNLRVYIYGLGRVQYGIKYGHFQVLRIFTGVVCLGGDENPSNLQKLGKNR